MAGEALTIAAQIDYVRVMRRIREFHASLDPGLRKAPAVRALQEQLALLGRNAGGGS